MHGLTPFSFALLYDLVEAAGVTGGGAGFLGARSVTAEDSWLFGEWCAGAIACRVSFFEGGGAGGLFQFNAEKLR